MQHSRCKRARKFLRFYQINFELHEPLKLVIGPEFLESCVSSQVKLEQALSRVLGSKFSLYAPTCVLEHFPLLEYKIKPLQCRAEEKGIPCVLEHLKFFSDLKRLKNVVAAVQDGKLRKTLRTELPSVPIVCVYNAGLQVEPPSFKAKEWVSERVKTLTAIDVKKEDGNVVNEKKKKKRKRTTNPNPLSIKKKKKMDTKIESCEKRKRVRKHRPRKSQQSSASLETSIQPAVSA